MHKSVISAHILIDVALDGMNDPDYPPFYEAIVENQIINLFTSNQINPEEFAYYCERFRRLAGREARKAA
ncbi:hypothetical protein [Pseudomonas petrae]|uniref:hypothetical protein n=1 Tax=Pseudomonas petrae TaxID=2912190 RepID=UPI001F3BE569|nr:hypothetical protein [Pseudomonas petrae]MCF7536196.1 hypothetical protein [Pseudomonas petrae]